MPPALQIKSSHRRVKQLALAGAVIAALLVSGLIPLSSGDLRTQIAAHKSAAAALRSKIDSDTSQIEQTANGITSARHRLGEVQGQLEAHIAQLRTVQTRLMNARDHLEILEKRLKQASVALAKNLRATYETGSPNLVSVILNAHGFSNLLEQVSFLKRMGHQDAQIVGVHEDRPAAGDARDRPSSGTSRNATDLTDQILRQRNQVAALESALRRRSRSIEDPARTGARARLADVNSQLRHAAAQAERDRGAGGRAGGSNRAGGQPAVGGMAIDTGGMVQPPAGSARRGQAR